MKKSTQELVNLSAEELNIKLLDLRKEQFHLRMKKANGSLDKTHHVTILRKTIARIKTIMTEKAGKSHVNQ